MAMRARIAPCTSTRPTGDRTSRFTSSAGAIRASKRPRPASSSFTVTLTESETSWPEA